MTKNLKIFTLFSFLWSIPYFMVLNWMLYDSNKRGIVMLPTYLVFGAGFSIAGQKLGKRDDQRKVRYSIWVRYVTVAVISSAIVGGIWVAIWQRNRAWWLLSYVVNVAAFLVVIYIYSRRSIKGKIGRAHV